MKDPGLWQRLQYHSFDDGTPLLLFRHRLANETGWTSDFCIKAIEEYKKFIYLVAISKEQLTPSQIIDEVWHLHLTYTHNYWDAMCAKIIGKPIHHAPTEGGFAEDKKYADAYLVTLERYKEEFSIEAPSEFWPRTQTPTVEPLHLTYDARRYMLVPRVPFSVLAVGGIGLLALAVSIQSMPLIIVGGLGTVIGALGTNWGNPTRNKNNGSCGTDAGTCGGHGGGHGGGCGGHGGGSCGGGH